MRRQRRLEDAVVSALHFLAQLLVLAHARRHARVALHGQFDLAPAGIVELAVGIGHQEVVGLFHGTVLAWPDNNSCSDERACASCARSSATGMPSAAAASA